MAESAGTRPISKKHLFVRDGLMKAELDEYLKRELAEEGYSGIVVRKSKTTEIIIIATRPSEVLGKNSQRIRELTAIVNKRWGQEFGKIDLYVERVANRGLCAVAQAESLRYKLLGGLPVRRAAYGVLRFVQESGGRGCEVMNFIQKNFILFFWKVIRFFEILLWFLVKSEVNVLKA